MAPNSFEYRYGFVLDENCVSQTSQLPDAKNYFLFYRVDDRTTGCIKRSKSKNIKHSLKAWNLKVKRSESRNEVKSLQKATEYVNKTKTLPKPTVQNTANKSLEESRPLLQDWNHGWPNGFFTKDFKFEEMKETQYLRSHWAEKFDDGHPKGDEHARSRKNGKILIRTCLGVIVCDNPLCQAVTRPQVKAPGVDSQLEKVCKGCGAKLTLLHCGVRSKLWIWSGGVRFENFGFHIHRQPPTLDFFQTTPK